jgi:hypothetical protein
MLWILGLLAVLVVGYYVYRALSDKPVTVSDPVQVLEEVKNEVVATLDVNQDGQVNVEDVKEVVQKTKKAAKKAAGKVKKAKSPKLKVSK